MLDPVKSQSRRVGTAGEIARQTSNRVDPVKSAKGGTAQRLFNWVDNFFKRFILIIDTAMNTLNLTNFPSVRPSLVKTFIWHARGWNMR